MAELRQTRGIADVVMLVLGLNLWATLLLVPLLHLRIDQVLLPALLAGLPVILLFAGVLWRSRVLLQALFPISMLPPIGARPALVGVNALSNLTFVLVGVALISFTVGASFLLARVEAPEAPTAGRDLEDATAQLPSWRARWFIYRMLTTFTIVLPLVLLFALYLRPGAFSDLHRFYPERANAAAALFGVLTLGLWLALFHLYVAGPARHHIRGDGRLRANLEQLERATNRRSPRLRFYGAVAVALALMALLFLRLSP